MYRRIASSCRSRTVIGSRSTTRIPAAAPGAMPNMRSVAAFARRMHPFSSTARMASGAVSKMARASPSPESRAANTASSSGPARPPSSCVPAGALALDCPARRGPARRTRRGLPSSERAAAKSDRSTATQAMRSGPGTFCPPQCLAATSRQTARGTSTIFEDRSGRRVAPWVVEAGCTSGERAGWLGERGAAATCFGEPLPGQPSGAAQAQASTVPAATANSAAVVLCDTMRISRTASSTCDARPGRRARRGAHVPCCFIGTRKRNLERGTAGYREKCSRRN